MKTNKWILAIAIAALGWVACDDDDDDLLDRQTLNDTDETFVEVAARSNMAEIRFGELAKTKASDSLVKVFAQQMIDEHNTAQNELKDLADDYAGIEWPTDMDEDHDETMNRLNEAEAYSFDSLYITTQVQMHEDASTAFQTATANSTDARVKAYATKYLPRIQMHLQKADSLETVIVTNNGTGTD
jgi:putative membrane protein